MAKKAKNVKKTKTARSVKSTKSVKKAAPQKRRRSTRAMSALADGSTVNFVAAKSALQDLCDALAGLSSEAAGEALQIVTAAKASVESARQLGVASSPMIATFDPEGD